MWRPDVEDIVRPDHCRLLTSSGEALIGWSLKVSILVTDEGREKKIRAFDQKVD